MFTISNKEFVNYPGSRGSTDDDAHYANEFEKPETEISLTDADVVWLQKSLFPFVICFCSVFSFYISKPKFERKEKTLESTWTTEH